MIDPTALQWTILGGAALLLGISKTGLPGVGILGILMAALVIQGMQSTGVILPMLIVGDVFAVAYYRRHAVWKYLVRLLPFSVAGVILGALAMYALKDLPFKPIIGGIILVMLALSYWNSRSAEVRVPEGWWFPVVMGLVGGTTTMMANAAGPVMIIYLIAMRLPRDAFLGTGAWYFLLINCFKVPFSAAGLSLITFETLKLNLVLAPLVVVGALLGVRLVKHVPQKAFNLIVQVLAAAGAIDLIVHPLLFK